MFLGLNWMQARAGKARAAIVFEVPTGPETLAGARPATRDGAWQGSGGDVGTGRDVILSRLYERQFRRRAANRKSAIQGVAGELSTRLSGDKR
jgi:hypothetical protein